MSDYHSHDVQVYYEDTDLSGAVYHANYLKFFERAREHVIGADELRRLHDEEGLGFVVYEADISFKRGARLGDQLEIRSEAVVESDYRAVFDQSAWPMDGDAPYVEATIEIVCIDESGELVPLPGVIPEVGT
ncbi:MAG: YbgC/FadM family acyl-CoA thioesterase [Bradymonadaceae bacterium]